LKIVGFPTFEGSWPWPWIGSYCTQICIIRRPLPTYQISWKSKTFCGRTDGRTFETDFIRSTQSSQPKYVFQKAASLDDQPICQIW